MSHITRNGASIAVDFVRGFKKVETFIKSMEGQVVDWVGDERDKLLKSVWNEANGKTDAPAPAAEETSEEK